MPTRLIVAEGAVLDEILNETFPLWNDGLSRDAYDRWNRAQTRTAWGQAHLRRFALIDGSGRILSSAKRYRFGVRLDGHPATMCGIGAVFTPPARRGHGHAADLIERLLAQERDEDATLAALFSEIGGRYYERLGFTVVPVEEVTIDVAQKGGAPAMLVRSGTDHDLAAIAAMHEVRSASARLALRRDPELIHFAISKRRLFTGLSPAGRRHTEFFVAEEGATAVAYVVLTQSPGGWTFEEGGDRDPAGARLGAMLQVLLARDPSNRPPLIRAWWPSAFPVPPQVELSERGPSRDLLMIRPLVDGVRPPAGEDVFYWRGDSF